MTRVCGVIVTIPTLLNWVNEFSPISIESPLYGIEWKNSTNERDAIWIYFTKCFLPWTLGIKSKTIVGSLRSHKMFVLKMHFGFVSDTIGADIWNRNSLKTKIKNDKIKTRKEISSGFVVILELRRTQMHQACNRFLLNYFIGNKTWMEFDWNLI